MNTKNYTAKDYEIALAALEKRGMAPSAKKMLKAHYSMPDRVATMRHIAAAIGYPHDHRQGNLRYGTFAGRLRRELQMPEPSMELWAVATWGEESIDDLNEFAFRMRPELAVALEKLGWVTSKVLVPKTQKPKRSAIEGEVVARIENHRKRENWLRDAKIAQELKQSSDGHLICQVPNCGFDFLRVYGETGNEYIQVHHLRPLSTRDEPEATKLSDLMLICANCHVMVHRDGENREVRTLVIA